MKLSEGHCVECRKGTAPMTREKAHALLEEIPGWEISDDGKWLRRSYKFKDFMTALDFVNKAGAVAEKEDHHPDIELGWGYVHIRLQTHAADGLHHNDFVMAAKIEKIQ